jgi:hypothetical protein
MRGTPAGVSRVEVEPDAQEPVEPHGGVRAVAGVEAELVPEGAASA